ncbi:Probable transmembrane protein [Caballeronia glathei]|uniref:Membrane protein n=1 Tax=Caballeronia glathei TaxID=60547 RepID=A0A069PDV8_9BURK|nr:YoaK family protein [Caballeronia glathei]KDR38662.1 membrane protein [Caballeronia glathei]CDY79145.1 Probable transmembrane protein [Caballeronia glathei]
MPADYFRALTGKDRTAAGDQQLGFSLAFVAGATNAGGFLAVKQYTSHMSGVVSAIADQAALGDVALVLSGAGSLISFLLGAVCSTVLVNWGRRRHLNSQYALPLLIEASLLLCFGLLGSHLALWGALFVPAAVALLCFIMGLQNAMVTKLSGAEIRTTHMTGIVTDIGVELGKLFYWNSPWTDTATPSVQANRAKLKVHGTMLGMFLAGGILGAAGFSHIGYAATTPLAALLTALAIVPLIDDLRGRNCRLDL